MRSKLFASLYLVFVLFGIYADDICVIPDSFNAYNEQDCVRLEWGYNGDEEHSLTEADFTVLDGWKRLNKEVALFRRYTGSLNSQHKKLGSEIDMPYCVQGGKYLIFFDSNASYDKVDFETDKEPFTSSVFATIDGVSTYSHDALQSTIASPSSFFTMPSFGIEKIISSSYYSEPTNSGFIEYDSTMLSNIFLINSRYSEWIRHNPWVAGKESNAAGIGESLTIEFIVPKDNIVVLNGYVDPLKRHLYNANNRVKTAIIRSLDADNPFEIEYTFEDYVHFAEINFPEKVDKVEFIIKDVYKGGRWNDTCVSAIITRWEPNPEPQYPFLR